MVAINHPAGWLAQFWLRAVTADWRQAGDRWTGLPAALRQPLEALLQGHDELTAMAEIVIASQLHFVYSADQDWCQHAVLPLLDWTEPTRARRTWDGFLTWGRASDPLLEMGLLAQLLTTAEHITDFSDDMRGQLYRHLGSVAIYSTINPVQRWLPQLTRALDASHRAEWMTRFAWMLGSLPADVVEAQWSRWIRHYWADRLNGTPLALTDEEASALASWTVYLTDSFSDGVDCATQHPASLAPHSRVLRAITEDRISQTPTAVAQLLAHLLRGTQSPFYDCDDLHRIVVALHQHLARTDTRGIIEQGVRLGCANAPDW